MTLIPVPKFPIISVDTSEALNMALGVIKRAPLVYLDLEADSLHHYHSKICLIQVHVEEVVFLIDPLNGIDIGSFLATLRDKNLVFHGADYDLRMLWQEQRFQPRFLFDTMLAAQLLGKSAFGLAALVQERFGLTLNKDHQKADWSRRPLEAELREYAAQDTVFLPELHRILTESLEALGRLDWHRQTCETLIKATQKPREIDPDNDPWRIQGSAKLYPRQLAVLRALWNLREKEAEERDIPSFKICPSELMLRLAFSVPSLERPEQLPHLPSRWSEGFRQAFIDTFEATLLLLPEEWPSRNPIARKPLKHPDPELLLKLREIRDAVATQLQLEPSLIATRAIMTAVALTGCKEVKAIQQAANWMGWQESILLEAWMAAARALRP